MKDTQIKSYLYAIAAILSWSTIASAFKITLNHLDYVSILVYSSLIACFVLFSIILFQKKLNYFRSLRFNDLVYAAVRGFLNPFLYYFVLLKAYSILRAQEAGTLNYIWPITLVILSIPLLKQKIKPLSILAILVSFCGILFISTEGNIMAFSFREPFGVFLALISSVFWALYWIFNMKDKNDEVIKLFLNFIFGFLYVLLFTLFFFELKIPDPAGLLGSVYIGIFEMGFTFFMWLLALKHSENTAKVSNLVYLSPFISLVIIHYTIGEKIIVSTIIGLILIVGGILLQHFINYEKQPGS